jgi:hypothetical protein
MIGDWLWVCVGWVDVCEVDALRGVRTCSHDWKVDGVVSWSELS